MSDGKLTAAQIEVVAAPLPPLGDLEDAIVSGAAVAHREPKLPCNNDVLALVQRFSSIEPPERALDYHWHFTALVLTYCDVKDIATLERYLPREGFREALEHAPPGVFDIRSWTYWNLICGRDPVPPLPQRRIPGVDHIPNLDPRRS
jgi:hypothetical protein